jgi:hypothetical protein
MLNDLVNKAVNSNVSDIKPKKYTYDPETQSYTEMANGGSVGSASKRADGIAQRGKTRGKMVMCGGGMAKK